MPGSACRHHRVARSRSQSLAQARRPTFDSHDELECYWPLGDRRGLFAMAWRRENLFGGGVPPVDPRPSPPGVVLRFRPPGLGRPSRRPIRRDSGA